VRPMRLRALLTASALAVALVGPAGTALASGGGQPTSGGAEVTSVAKPAPKRFRVAYRHWRARLEQHGLHVGRDLLAGLDARAADDTATGPTERALRDSIHRMQRRWGQWLRSDPQGRAVAFKLRVRRHVPGWGKAQLRKIAWCESKSNPRAVGGGGAYRGMYQFSVSTWAVVGGSGDPVTASRWEQTWRAWLLLSRDGTGHWPNCG